MSTTISVIDNPHVMAVIARRALGEQSVWAWQCESECGCFDTRPRTGKCYGCGEPVKAYRGYWGTCDEFEGNDAWFYPLAEVREAAAS